MKNPLTFQIKNRKSKIKNLLLLALLATSGLALPLAQAAASESLPPPAPIDPGLIQPVVDGLLGHYGWLTTVLLVIGTLRILFKPIMLALENALKNDPEKLATIQRFEASAVYKTIATLLDVTASIKLPLVKPPSAPRS